MENITHETEGESATNIKDGSNAPTYKFGQKAPTCNSFTEIDNYLKQYRNFVETDPSFEDENIQNLLRCIQQFYLDHKDYRIKIASALVKYKFPDFLKKLLLHAEDVGVFTTDSIWFPTYFALDILSHYSDVSIEFTVRLIELGFVKYYTCNLKNQDYVKNQNELNAGFVVLTSLSTLHNCIKHVPGEQCYEDEHVKTIVERYLQSEYDQKKTVAIMIVSAISSDDENAHLEDAGSIPFMVKCVIKAKAKRLFGGFPVTELLDCLARIALNDDNKIKLIDAGLLPGIVEIMQKGSEDLQEKAASFTWTLCFNADAREQVKNHRGYLEALDKLTKSRNDKVQKAAKGAQWTINGKISTHTNSNDAKAKEKHIFLSYQHGNQDMVVRIKNCLKKDNFTTWMDVDQMEGDTIEAMAGAVENAAVGILCISREYKASNNCRKEAEYMFQNNIPIVPLYMEGGYKADGWLGFIMGSKFYVRFDGKSPFSQAYNELKKQIQSHLKDIKPVVNVNVSDAPKVTPDVTPKHFPSVQWEKHQVAEWVTTNNLRNMSTPLQELFDRMDGRLFLRFCSLRKEVPEYFYKQLKRKYKLDMFLILQLTDAMDNVKIPAL